MVHLTLQDPFSPSAPNLKGSAAPRLCSRINIAALDLPRELSQIRPSVRLGLLEDFCDIGFAARGQQLVVFTAIDNLVKGAAGQAIQNMNLMFGLDEKTGLIFAGSNP